MDLTFMSFHSELLVDEPEATVFPEMFAEWLEVGREPGHDECVGLVVPMFRGASDDVSNLQVISMEVDWVVTGELLVAEREARRTGRRTGHVTIVDE